MGVEATTVPLVDGTELSYTMLVLAGPTQGSGTLKGASADPTGSIRSTAKATNTYLLLADSRAGLNRYVNPATGFWILPPMAYIGNLRDPATPREIGWLVQRNGLGLLNINPSSYRGELASTAAMAALNSPTPVPGDWCQNSGDTHAPYMLRAGGTASVAGDWVKQSGANRPRVHWGTVANQSAMIGLTGALVGDMVQRSDDGNLYHLQGIASGPNYYALAANWVIDTGLPTTPGIFINWNNKNVSTLGRGHEWVLIMSNGIDSYDAG